MAAKRNAKLPEAAPTYVDYVVRYAKAATFMRSQVVRAESEDAATQAALTAVAPGGAWYGWAIVDVMTVEEAKERMGARRG